MLAVPVTVSATDVPLSTPVAVPEIVTPPPQTPEKVPAITVVV